MSVSDGLISHCMGGNRDLCAEYINNNRGEIFRLLEADAGYQVRLLSTTIEANQSGIFALLLQELPFLSKILTHSSNELLVACCYSGKIDIARTLLLYNDVKVAVAVSGNFPLCVAIKNGYVHIVNLLLEYSEVIEAFKINPAPVITAAISC